MLLKQDASNPPALKPDNCPRLSSYDVCKRFIAAKERRTPLRNLSTEYGATERKKPKRIGDHTNLTTPKRER